MAPNTDISTRSLVVALKSPHGGKPTSQIHELTGIPPRTIDSIYAKAIQRGFEPNHLPIQIRDSHVTDAPRSGRPTKRTEQVSELVAAEVRTDRYGREKSCANISGFLSEKGVNISASTVHRILRKNGFRKTKPTRKPGLTEAMKTARYNWCLERKDWTLEQWKDVIFSDETAVVLGHRRGGYRV